VAAGSGTRFGGQKLLETVGDRTVLELSVSTALAVPTRVVVVVSAEILDVVTRRLESLECAVVVGADTRSGSVRAGLEAVPEEAEVIAVHDGARPLAGTDIYERGIEAVAAGADCAVPVMPVVDTMREVGGGVVERQHLRAVQTPQLFRAVALRQAHDGGQDATDDATLVESIGGKVVLVDGARSNIKVTEPIDLAIVRALVSP
jgi:2-C-methyl-D-erythritol 4-phosphate cytidylyltransferase